VTPTPERTASHPAIPFNRPYVGAAASENVEQSLSGRALCGDGPFTARATAALSALVGSRPTLLTTSCTHALELAWLLLGLEPGDEVIMPSFTFVSTANAVALRGAIPVFVDVRPDTLNLDERLLEQAITSRTRAICVVHYAGVACEMDVITEIAARHGIAVVEDNAHGLGGTYRGTPLGSIGVLAAQSFHETKNLQCGEGGALVMREQEHVDRAEIMREKGTNRTQFHRGVVDKYSWVDIGSSYLPSDLLAGVLLAGLEEFDDIQRRRHHVWSAYDAALRTWAGQVGATQPTVPDDCEHPAHLYYLLVERAEQRGALIRHLADAGVHATFHYVPLHSSQAGRRLGRLGTSCEVTDDVSSRLLRLPLFPELDDAGIDRVVDAVTSFAG
jgi:dTDP-4-amino-4,6-dideoxygalactose transaminase